MGAYVANSLKTKAISRLKNGNWLSIVSTEEQHDNGYAHIVRVVETTDGCFYNTTEENVVAIHSTHRRCITPRKGCQCCSDCHQYVVSQNRAQEIFNRIATLIRFLSEADILSKMQEEILNHERKRYSIVIQRASRQRILTSLCSMHVNYSQPLPDNLIVRS